MITVTIRVVIVGGDGGEWMGATHCGGHGFGDAMVDFLGFGRVVGDSLFVVGVIGEAVGDAVVRHIVDAIFGRVVGDGAVDAVGIDGLVKATAVGDVVARQIVVPAPTD